MDIDALNPEFIISLDENSYIDGFTLRRVHRSLHYISQGVDAPQCIGEALQKRFTFPRTVIALSDARPTDIGDENATRRPLVWFNRRLKILY